MQQLATVCLVVGLLGCASVPRGPSDAEVRAALDGQIQQMIREVLAGNTDSFAAHFAPRGEMVLNGVAGPAGAMLYETLTGPDQIRSFMNQVGAPPDFNMEATGFSRSGEEAQQNGSWSIAMQTGTFTLNWRQTAEGTWRITRWRLDGT